MSLPGDFTLRAATPTDAETIQAQRDAMWLDMGALPERIWQSRAESLNWLRAALADDSYTGMLAEGRGQVVGGAGVIWQRLPPSPRTLSVVRAYLLNVYVQPSARGHGLAGQMVRALLAECRRRGVDLISLHASEAGRPLYAALGFQATNEMRLVLGAEVPA